MRKEPRDPADAVESPPSDKQFLAMYEELRRLAAMLFAGERGNHTLQATALLNEAFLRLRSCGDETVGDPLRFKAAAANAMRRALIAHARTRNRQKRGGGFVPLSLDSVELASAGAFDEVLAVDEAIERLQQEAPELAEIVRLRFYAGLEVAEVARVTQRSERSVARDWTYAKTRLYQLLRDLAG